MDINKKIAEWVGFEFDGGRWYEPNVKHSIVNQYYENYRFLPDFTTSLDALFKWVVPEIQKTNEIEIVMPPGDEGRAIVRIGHQESVDENTLALALCYAVEKLIDRIPLSELSTLVKQGLKSE